MLLAEIACVYSIVFLAEIACVHCHRVSDRDCVVFGTLLQPPGPKPTPIEDEWCDFQREFFTLGLL
jgi:hypothetical protein